MAVRKDFYIDMVGEAEIASEDNFIETPVMIIQLVIVLITFPSEKTPIVYSESGVPIIC